jgi:hypothetical protein
MWSVQHASVMTVRDVIMTAVLHVVMTVQDVQVLTVLTLSLNN